MDTDFLSNAEEDETILEISEDQDFKPNISDIMFNNEAKK